MKENLININSQKMMRRLLRCLMLVTIVLPGIAFSQTDSSKKEEPATVTPLVEFTSTQKGDNTIDLKGSFKAKINGSLTKLEGLKVEFFAVGDAETKLGEAVTDRNGVAIVNTKADQLTADTAGKLNFKLSFAGNKTIDPDEETLAIKRARLELTPTKGDSLNSLQIKLVDVSTGTETPVPATDLAVFVKRLFNPLKIGEGKTDEAGEASIDIPKNLPGDEKGNLTLLARVQDNEVYGNIETPLVQQWGTPVSSEMKEFPRALWSTHPPMWMLITFIILMGTVWGHYIVIVFELFRLKKEH
jgi:hypothetical protein